MPNLMRFEIFDKSWFLVFGVLNVKCGRTFISAPNQVLSSLEMALSLSPQGFAQSHVGERCLPLMPYKPLA